MPPFASGMRSFGPRNGRPWYDVATGVVSPFGATAATRRPSRSVRSSRPSAIHAMPFVPFVCSNASDTTPFGATR